MCECDCLHSKVSALSAPADALEFTRSCLQTSPWSSWNEPFFGPTVCSHLQAQNPNPYSHCGAANRNAVRLWRVLRSLGTPEYWLKARAPGMLGAGWNGGSSSALAELRGKSRGGNVTSLGREQNFLLGVGRRKGIEVGGFWCLFILDFPPYALQVLFDWLYICSAYWTKQSLSLCQRAVKESCASYLRSFDVILIRWEGTKQLTEGESSSQSVLRASQQSGEPWIITCLCFRSVCKSLNSSLKTCLVNCHAEVGFADQAVVFMVSQGTCITVGYVSNHGLCWALMHWSSLAVLAWDAAGSVIEGYLILLLMVTCVTFC